MAFQSGAFQTDGFQVSTGAGPPTETAGAEFIIAKAVLRNVSIVELAGAQLIMGSLLSPSLQISLLVPGGGPARTSHETVSPQQLTLEIR